MFILYYLINGRNYQEPYYDSFTYDAVPDPIGAPFQHLKKYNYILFLDLLYT